METSTTPCREFKVRPARGPVDSNWICLSDTPSKEPWVVKLALMEGYCNRDRKNFLRGKGNDTRAVSREFFWAAPLETRRYPRGARNDESCSTTSKPTFSEEVAAGDGALQTLIVRSSDTIRKSS